METMELSINELELASGGYIVKDEEGYHVINDTEGYVVHTFQEDEYDLMMKLITRAWKHSAEFITWDEAHEIHRKSLEEFMKTRQYVQLR